MRCRSFALRVLLMSIGCAHHATSSRCCCKPDWGDSTTKIGVLVAREFLVNIPTR